MFNPLKAVGDLKTMRDQAMKMQQMLAAEEVAVEKNGVKVVMTGDQKIKEILIDGQEDWRIKEALSEAIKKSQEIAAKKLTEMNGGLQGLLGGGK
ncbi:YbaB/EbfC family nucleoid-associated protein [Patescibacteria group bacterium]|nr:YbaB/EbfC family nucleoid-associated protein [Patescibacteria group bacterium]MCL5797560.1 YbaB/EbfC family nucleoid-associated protein [Patescibacteria group bacterium]